MTNVMQREMRWDDIPQLVALEQELFAADAWSEAVWWQELAGRPRRNYTVLQRDSAVIGYAGLDIAGELADVMTIAVAPQVQRGGHGRQLLEWLVATSKESGATALMLEVRADNAPANRLYESVGFERVNVRRKYYQPGNVDALILRLPLRGES